VARKQTALEASQLRKDGVDTVRQLGRKVAVVLALVGGIGCLAQAVQVHREDATVASLTAARVQIRDEVAAKVAALQAALRGGLEDADLRAAVALGNSAAAEARLRQLLPDLVRAEFYPPELPQLIEADLQQFGYGRANMLSEARAAGGSARAQLLRTDDGRLQLALAQVVREGERTIGYAYVLLPGDALASGLQAASFAGGRLTLRQGLLGTELAASAEAGAGADEAPLPIAQSILSVGLQRPEFFKAGDLFPLFDSRNKVTLVVVGVLLLLLSALPLLLRVRVGGKAGGAAAQVAGGLLGKLKPADKAPAEPVMPPMQPAKQPAAEPGKPVAKAAPQAAVADSVDRSIFRAYDIRGVVGETLTHKVARQIGRAVGSAIRDRGLSEVVVGRDGRLSGPELAAELIKGLRSTGCDVIDIGAAPTPLLYFATYHLNAGSGVMVTGSHNPPEYNGFKIVVGGETLAEDAIQALYQRIAEGSFTTGTGGLQVIDVAEDYIERVTGDVQSERRLKVVVDAGNGIAGAIAPQVLEGIGAEVVPLYCEVDGTFPNHHPDPSEPANLQDLIASVQRVGADLGVAFDGDGDRLGVVTASGEIIYPDRLLMLFAMDVLNRNPGATIIYDVKCTGHLQDVILRHGGSPVMWKTGHSLIKAKMREDDAELAGEMSGHFFFRERWFGFDDGIYAAARLLEILGASDRAPQAVFDELPKGVSTPELKIKMAEGAHYAFIGKFRDAAAFPGARISSIDGIRADYPDGWGLVRCSNTTPSLVLRFDADNAEALARIQDEFRKQILAIDGSLKLPF
jgi:phosphomannomutase/phosphoglucomutase